MKTNILLLLAISIIFNGCKSNEGNLSFVEKVEKAHVAKDFLHKMQYNLT
jgi:hypothetical protein